MMDHFRQRHLRGVFVTEHHHAERVPDENDVDPAFIKQTRGRIIVGREGGDPLAPPFSLTKILHRRRPYHFKPSRTTAVAAVNRPSKMLTDSVCFGRTRSGRISANGRRTNSRSAIRGWGNCKAPVSIARSPK